MRLPDPLHLHLNFSYSLKKLKLLEASFFGLKYLGLFRETPKLSVKTEIVASLKRLFITPLRRMGMALLQNNACTATQVEAFVLPHCCKYGLGEPSLDAGLYVHSAQRLLSPPKGRCILLTFRILNTQGRKWMRVCRTLPSRT